MNRPVTLARVLSTSHLSGDRFVAWVDAKNLGAIRFDSITPPDFEAGDFVAVVAGANTAARWTAANDNGAFALCTRGEFGLLGDDEDRSFIIDSGMHLRPDPTFQVTHKNKGTAGRANCGMLVVPSYSKATPGIRRDDEALNS